MEVETYRDRAERIARAALADGDPMRVTRISPSRIAWDVSHRCTNPLALEIVGRSNGEAALPIHRPLVDIGGWLQPLYGHNRGPLFIDMTVRCRRCIACLKVRSTLWRFRAESELFASERTWWCTMTFNPHQQHVALATARKRAADAKLDFETLSNAEQFRRRVAAMSPEVTRFLKRVRKNSRAKFRYLLVAEAHKSGAPHFHMLIHERAGEPISWQTLTDAWKVGFSKFKLAKSGSGPFDETDRKLARYVCKYLAKSALARVRASARYGEAGTVSDHSESVNPTTTPPNTETAGETGPGLEKSDPGV